MSDQFYRERTYQDYIYNDDDKLILHEMLLEVNQFAGTNFEYLAELVNFSIKGTGEIFVKYISRFSSESTRAYLIYQIAADKVPNCDKLLLELYKHFQKSDWYIGSPGKSPVHIYARYDTAFKRIPLRQISHDLIEVISNPLDAYYLPLTVRKLASYKLPEMEPILWSYVNETYPELTGHCLSEDIEVYNRYTQSIKERLKKTGIEGLKYYPSEKVQELFLHYVNGADPALRHDAIKYLKFWEKHTYKTLKQ